MVRKQGLTSSWTVDRLLNHLAAAGALSEGILVLTEVTSQESVQAGTGRAGKNEESCEFPHDDPWCPQLHCCSHR